MPPTYVLARDYLECAMAILQGCDSRSRQLRHIIKRTVDLMEEPDHEAPPMTTNVLDFAAFRRLRRAGR